jgi:hypothetical protein
MNGKKVYAIDLKVYYSIPQDSCPFDLSECQNQVGSISAGYHVIVRNWTEKVFDEFVEWCYANEDLIKMIGHHFMPTSEQRLEMYEKDICFN